MRSLCAAVVCLGLLLPGCGEPLPDADFTFISGVEHNDFDPQRMSWSHDVRLAHCLYDTLVRLDFGDMSIHPATAERWDVSEDGRTYTFHLRADAKWSDGKPVTAGDFVAAWRRAMLPDLAADYTQLMFHIEGAQAFFERRQEQLDAFARIRGSAGGDASTASDAAAAMWRMTRDEFDRTVGLRAIDDRTLEVRLTAPTPYFLELCAFATFMPVPRHVVEKDLRFNPETGAILDDGTYWSDPERLVTNGPYRLEMRRFRVGSLLRANDHYYDRAAMANETVKELVITTEAAALGAYERGDADFYADIPTGSATAADLLAQQRPDAHAQTMAGTYFYNFNCLPKLPDGRENPLADARVRRALSLAIDREALVNRVTRIGQPVARSYVPPGVIKGYEPPTDAGVLLDVEEARRLLAEAGYDNPAALTGLSILYNTDAAHHTIAQAVQEMWRQNLGVVVTLEPQELRAFRDRLKSQRYSIARASWFGDYPDPTTFLEKMTTGDGNNDCRWSNAEFDGLIERAKTIADPAERMRTLQDAERVLLEEQPMALLFQYVNVYLYDETRVRGLESNAWNRWRFENAAVVSE